MKDDFFVAYGIAQKHHAGQLYGNHDYMYHLEAVADRIKNETDSHLCVAYLHDIIEDTDYTVEELASVFDKSIVDAVIAITKVKGEDYLDYLCRVADNKLAWDVKIADTLCNLNESVKGKQWGRVRKYNKQLGLLVGNDV